MIFTASKPTKTRCLDGLWSRRAMLWAHFNSVEGYSVQKTLRWCAANINSKINLLVYEWAPYKMQNLLYEWVNFAKIFHKILEKSGDFAQKCPKLNWLVYEWVTFSWKIGIRMGLLSNSAVAHPYQNQTLVPSPPSLPPHCHQPKFSAG